MYTVSIAANEISGNVVIWRKTYLVCQVWKSLVFKNMSWCPDCRHCIL